MRTRLCLSAYHPCSSPTLPMERGESSDVRSASVSADANPRFVPFIGSDRADIPVPFSADLLAAIVLVKLVHYVCKCTRYTGEAASGERRCCDSVEPKITSG